MSVLDVSPQFAPTEIAAALARLWAVDGEKLIPAVDVRGVRPKCPITLEPLQDSNISALLKNTVVATIEKHIKMHTHCMVNIHVFL
jgi:hypothetical protein